MAPTDSFTYTVQDDYGRQTATVTVNITAGSFLVANDVSRSTTKDKFIDIDVVAAASVSTDLSPAVVKPGSITAPALGTAALQTSGKIRYTPPTGDDGFSEEFDFTLKPSAVALPELTATVTVDVLADVVVDNRPKSPPDAPADALTATPGTFADVYGSAKSGDQIVLDDGTYGAFTLSRSFDTTNPVIIRAKNLNKAVFSGKITLTAGVGHWLYEIKTTYNGANETDCAITCGNWTTITRCWLASRDAILINAQTGFKHHVWIGWNRINGKTTSGAADDHVHIKFLKSTSNRGMQFHDIFVYRNYFGDIGNVPSNDTPAYHIYMGNSHVFDGLYPGMNDEGDIARFDNFYIEENFMAGTSVRQRFLYLKNGLTECARNRSAKTSQVVYSQRHGYGTHWFGNRTGGGSWAMGGGGKSSQRTLMYRNAGGTVNLDWGNSNRSDGANDHQAADWYQLYGNSCDVVIGEGGTFKLDYDGGIIDHLEIYQHTGNIDQSATSRFDSKTLTINKTGNPLNLQDPLASNITDNTGTVLATFDGDDTGQETGNQD